MIDGLDRQTMTKETTRRNVLLGSVGLGLLPLSSLPAYSKETNEQLVACCPPHRKAILEEHRISLTGMDGVISQHNPISLMDIAVNWFYTAQRRGWKYYDERGLIIRDNMLDKFIKELQDVRNEAKD